jgi:AraC-like DNA-binding protein
VNAPPAISSTAVGWRCERETGSQNGAIGIAIRAARNRLRTLARKVKRREADDHRRSYDSRMQPDWVSHTAAVMQSIAAEVALSEATEFIPLLRRGLDRIEATPDDWHNALLRMVLVDLAGHIVRAVHLDDGSSSCSCHVVAWEHLPLLTHVDDADPRVAFWKWAERFLAHVCHEHPPSPAQRAAALIRSDSGKMWTLRELAHTVDTHQGRLSRQFEKRFGLRPSAYVHLVRISRAVALFRTPAKVEAIASEVGYRSKKDFYGALKRWVGLTSTELRGLRNDESIWLERELRRRSLPTAAQFTTNSELRLTIPLRPGPSSTH